MKLSLTFTLRLALLALLLMLGMILSGGLTFVLGKVSANAVAVTRIGVVAQDLLAFIIPAVVLALLVTRLPAEFLMIKRMPNRRQTVAAVLTLIAAFPAIECISGLCAQLPWPQEVLDLEASMAANTDEMLGAHNVANLLVSILIMGVLAGLAEELFFRGALQQVLRSRPMSVHAAVWGAAIVFSLMHAQPVGALPRVLLGAFFGYATVWSGSLWTAVICHAVNNTVVILTMWAGADIAFMSTPAAGVVSALLAAAGIWVMRRYSSRYSRSRSSGI